jgi:hypothetical protein
MESPHCSLDAGISSLPPHQIGVSMKSRHFVLVALLVLPAIATAQRSRAGVRDPNALKMDEGPQGPALRPRDVEELSPLRLLIDKRKDLKLSDAQVDAMKQAEKKQKDANEPLMKAIDSLVHEMRPPLNRTPESDARMRDARVSLQETIGKVREAYDASAKEALAGFDADQQTKANEMLARLKEEGDKRLREKMRPAGSRGGEP